MTRPPRRPVYAWTCALCGKTGESTEPTRGLTTHYLLEHHGAA